MDNTRCGWAALVLLGASCLAGCGGGAHAKPDGGGDGPITADGAITGMHAYNVTAVLRPTTPGVSPPATSSFTLIADTEARLAIAGGNGRGAAVSLTTTDGLTYHGGGSFTVGDDGEACSGVVDVRYDSFEVTLADRSVTGTATGSATISCGDCSFFAPFAATLTGTTDDTAPTLHATGGSPASPFDPFTLIASEPLPASAAAH